MAIGNLVINISLFAHQCPFPGHSWALPLWFGLVWLSLCRCVCSKLVGLLVDGRRLETILADSQGSVLGTPFDLDDFCTIKSHPCNCVMATALF